MARARNGAWPAKSPLVVEWRNAVLSELGPESPTVRLVLLALSSHMDGSGVAWPSQRTLARETALSQRVVGARLRDAQRAGWIERATVGTSRGWRRHSYRPVLPATTDDSGIQLEDVGA